MSKSATTTTNNNGKTNKVGTGDGNSKSDEPIYSRYPVLSSWEFVLSNTKDPVSGMVYCTDEASQTIILIPSALSAQQQSSLTLTTEVRILNANCIVKSTKLGDPNPSDVESMSFPVTPIHKKALEDRERRAIRQAEEVFRHINAKVTPEGQDVFDRLLKACGEVSWKDESIIVLNQIQVDPPYGPDNCKILAASNGKQLLGSGSAQEGLDRVRKIVSDSRKG
ncbi:hypothetical protein ACA910_009233 [Epithemia clementina (nom. ined.)]